MSLLERQRAARESEAREILARLPGRPFLLLSGPSGCGKTSLICAGVLPRLARPFLVEGVAGCRVALVDPSPGPDADPLAAEPVADNLRDGGVSYQNYVNELASLLFLKMCQETGQEQE